MKKFGQLCGFLTGNLPDFQYHSQKGKSLKGSRFEIHLGDSVIWIGEKAIAKQAASLRAAHVVDKTVKIVELFQGLITGAQTGMVYDSDTARMLATTEGSVVWSRTMASAFLCQSKESWLPSVPSVRSNRCLAW
jgi:hypothetical protein